jgi:ubiquinone/menaquinone biosynthesis C-methylase UbiE
MNETKWPKILPALTEEQQIISDKYMLFWHEVLVNNPCYSLFEKFNHRYPIKHAPKEFLHTLEIGAGLGEHISHEKLTPQQKENYVALDLRENMAEKIRQRHPEIQTVVGDCQKQLLFADNHFDRILAIHVLEHLPNLPAAIEELYRVCNKEKGIFSVVIPCEGGMIHSLARQISSQRVFEKKYKQPYKWFIEQEHVNLPHEIFEELQKYFQIKHISYFPFILPSVNSNLCIGITLQPVSKPLATP